MNVCWLVAGIVTCVPGEGGGVKANPVIQCLDRLKQIGQKDLDEMVELLDKLAELCGVEGSGNAAIATKNGGVELVCSKIRSGSERVLASALKALASLLHGITVNS